MSGASDFQVGDKVRVIAEGRLGVLDPDDINGRSFHPDVFLHDGDEAEYAGAHPSIDGWHMLLVERDGFEYEAPVHRDQFEEAG
jgi:hypothetical protein